jgi:hypothetical protein
MRLGAGRGLVAVAILTLALPALAQSAPRVTHNCAKVHTAPRPCKAATQVTPHTSIYFEVTVPTTNAAGDLVDPNSIAATITRTGGTAVTMFGPGQVWAAGYTGETIPSFTDGTRTGYGFFTQPNAPLQPSSTYTVRVSGATLSGIPIDATTTSWSFTTRRDLAGSAASFDIDLAAPTATWEGRFFSGMVKPNFNTSAIFDQEPVYDLIDQARESAPEFFLQQRDWPLFADYWSNLYFDGAPNLVRERETRRIVSIVDDVNETILFLDDLLEAPLYGISGRRLSDDYDVGDQVLVCDRSKSEVATVLTVRSSQNRIHVTKLAIPAASWELDFPGSKPGDSPDTPGNFTHPLGALRKFRPAGTPVYYWARLDDEWDRHVAHGRRPHVNVEAVGIDLCITGRVNGTTGGDCANLPKDWLEWHGVIRALIDHIVDRYGEQVADWYYSIGNEPNHNTFWGGTDDEFLAFYDYTANALLHALEARGIDRNRVRIGGGEAGGSADPVGYTSHLLYHASPTAVDPTPGFDERNRVCIDPAFAGLRSTDVEAICTTQGGFGTPVDFVSIHAYKRAADAADSLIQMRQRSLDIDPVTFDRLRVNSHETTPDWITSRDPGGREMYRWGGYFSSWGGDFFRRMLDVAMTDPRKREGEITVTVWPYCRNLPGNTCAVGQLAIDQNGDGVEDRVDAVPVPFFHMAYLASTMSHALAPIGTRQDAGVTLSGWRSVEPLADRFLLYAHDVYDTQSAEPGGWNVTLRLRNLRFPQVDVTEYRFDNDHPARAALAALPDRGSNGVYTPAEVAAFVDAAQLRPIGPAVRYPVAGGALDLPTRLLAGGVVFLDVRGSDPDGDGVFDPEDCAPNDPQTYRAPAEIPDLGWTDRQTFTWTSAIPAAGPSTVHDVARDATCLASGIASATWTDGSAPAPGTLFRYLVRGRNSCGAGWGTASDGTDRTGGCP